VDLHEREQNPSRDEIAPVYEKAKPPGTSYAEYLVDPSDRIEIRGSDRVRNYGKTGFLARHKVTGALSWVKTFHEITVDSRDLQREIPISLVHPALLGAVGLSIRYDWSILVTEYMRHGSLDMLVDDPELYSRLSATAKVKIAVGVALGMRYIHERGFAYSRLHSAKILLDENDEPRIAEYPPWRFFDATMVCHVTAMTERAIYMTAPEGFTLKHGKEADLFSYAMILWEIISGRYIVSGYPGGDVEVRQHLSRVRAGARPTMDGMEAIAEALLESLWAHDPSDRMAFAEVCEFLKQNNYEIIPGIDRAEVVRYVKRIEDYEAVYPPVPRGPRNDEWG
jgi:serine/threonine protein kinase